MNIKLPFVIDPKDEKPSVTLSLLIVSVLVVLIAFGLNISGKTKDTSIAIEFFGICAGLYLGRKMNFRGVTDVTPDTVLQEIKK